MDDQDFRGMSSGSQKEPSDIYVKVLIHLNRFLTVCVVLVAIYIALALLGLPLTLLDLVSSARA